MNLVNISNYGLQVAGVYGVWAGPWKGNNVAGSMNIEGLTVNGNAITSMPASGTDVVNQTPLTFTFNFIPAPTITPVESGNNLQLLWPANYIGWTLQAQTNAPGGGIGTNWGIVSGSTTTNQFSITPDTTTWERIFPPDQFVANRNISSVSLLHNSQCAYRRRLRCFAQEFKIGSRKNATGRRVAKNYPFGGGRPQNYLERVCPEVETRLEYPEGIVMTDDYQIHAFA